MHQPYSTAWAQVSPLLGGRSLQFETAPPLPPLLAPPVVLAPPEPVSVPPALVPPVELVVPPVTVVVLPPLVLLPPVAVEVPPVPVDWPPVVPTGGLPPVVPTGGLPPVVEGGVPPEPPVPSCPSVSPLTQDARNTRVVAPMSATVPRRAKRKLAMHLCGITQTASRRARCCTLSAGRSFHSEIFWKTG